MSRASQRQHYSPEQAILSLVISVVRTDLSVLRVIAEVGLVEVMMRVVTLSWRDDIDGSFDKEIVGEEVVRDIARWALAAIGF